MQPGRRCRWNADFGHSVFSGVGPGVPYGTVRYHTFGTPRSHFGHGHWNFCFSLPSFPLPHSISSFSSLHLRITRRISSHLHPSSHCHHHNPSSSSIPLRHHLLTFSASGASPHSVARLILLPLIFGWGPPQMPSPFHATLPCPCSDFICGLNLNPSQNNQSII